MENPIKGKPWGGLLRGLLVLSFGVASLLGQTSRGTLTGIVTDAQGGAIPAANVTLNNEATNVQRTTQTNEAGLYRFDAVDPGSYTVNVQSAGFQQYSKRQIPVAAASTVSIDVKMEVGETQQTIEVVAQSESVLQYEAPVRGGTIDSRQLVNQPLPTRRVIGLALTLPGVVSNRFTSNGGSNVFNMFAVNGARQRSNNFMIDGTENNDISVSGEGMIISNPDAVQEVNIQTTNYDAEFGRAAGAVVNVITKSGTNQFHGTAHYVLDSTYDDAITNTQSLSAPIRDRGRPPFGIEHWWGGTIGGPIKKDRTFFFASFQEDRLRSLTTRTLATWSAEGRDRINALFPRGTNRNVDLYNELTSGVTATSQFFPVNLGGTRGTAQFGTAIFPQAVTQTDYQVLSRVDHKLGERDQLSGRLILSRTDANPAIANRFPGFESSSVTRNYSGSITETHVFSPTMTNELRLNFMRLRPLFPADATSPVALTRPVIQFAQSGGLTELGLPANIPQGRYGNNYQLQNTATKIMGTHSLRFGGDILHQRSKQFAPIAERGLVTFSPSTGFETFANFLDDFSGTAGGQVGRDFGTAAYYPDMNRLAFFFSDRWRATSDLTLTLGGRYEYFGTPMNSLRTAAWAGLFNIDPVTFTGPFSQPSKVKRDLNNWSPSLGIAWSPSYTSGLLGRLLGNKMTVIRTGYQIGYDSFFNNIASNAQTSTPNVVAFNITPDLATQPRGVPNALQSIPATPRPFSPADQQLLMPSNLVNPYIQRWSFGIQRQLPGNFIYDIGYVGSKGTRLFITEENNPQVPTSLRITPVSTVPIPANRLTGRLDNLQGPRENRTNGGSSSYHALQMAVNRRLGRGLLFGASYTWSKTIDNGSEIFSQAGVNFVRALGVPPMFGGLQLDRGLSLFHRSHRLVFNYVYEIPVFKNQQGALGRVLGGWQLSGVTTFESGVPVSVTNGLDADGVGGGAADRPDINFSVKAPIRAIVDATSPTGYVNPDVVDATSATGFRRVPIDPKDARYIQRPQFAGTTPLRPGYASRGTDFLPGINNWNFALSKTIRLTERFNLQFRADTFNILNHPQYGTPSVSAFSPAQTGIQGAITAAVGRFLQPQFADGGGRVMRYEMRLRF